MSTQYGPVRLPARLRHNRQNRCRPTITCRPHLESLEIRMNPSAHVTAAAVLATARPYDGPREIHGVGYSPTWPNWSPTSSKQLEDSDFYNSAFQALWNTPRVNVSHSEKLSDLQAMNQIGFNLIRLYDWNPVRGFNPSGQGTSDHLAFLDAAQANGLKVMVPISNYNLGDTLWGANGAPDASYSFNSAPPAVRVQLDAFIRSITRNGQIHPAVFGFEVGNEIDLNSGAWTHGDIALITRRSLWWVVNLQEKLNQNPTDPNRLRFTIPVSNADEDVTSLAKRSWFQVFRDGATQGSLAPLGPPNGTPFSAPVTGLVPLKGADWYETWFFNSYQTFKLGADLREHILEQYARGGAGPEAPWNKRWPGEKFDVPLLLTELGSKLVIDNNPVKFITEEKYSNQVAEEQALVAERFLRSERNEPNPSFIGYTIFEFNDEPNKTGYAGPTPTVETNRGVFKYYSSRNPLDFRNGGTPTFFTAGPTTVPYNGGSLPAISYPVFPLNAIAHSGRTSLNAALEAVIRGGAVRRRRLR